MKSVGVTVSTVVCLLLLASANGNMMCRETSECDENQYCDLMINMCSGCDHLCADLNQKHPCQTLCKDAYKKKYEATTTTTEPPMLDKQLSYTTQSMFEGPGAIAIYVIIGALMVIAVFGSVIIFHNKGKRRSIQHPIDEEQGTELIVMKETDYHGSKEEIAVTK